MALLLWCIGRYLYNDSRIFLYNLIFVTELEIEATEAKNEIFKYMGKLVLGLHIR